MGVIFRRCCRYGVGKLRRRAKVLLRRLASQQILFLLYTCVRLHYCRLLSPGDFPVKQLATGMPDFCGLNTLVGYGALAEAMARWQAGAVSALITLTPLFTLLFFLIYYQWPGPMFSPDRC